MTRILAPPFAAAARSLRVLPVLAVIFGPVPPPAAAQEPASTAPGWFAFDPPPDSFDPSPIDLRKLNEAYAGENGFIAAKDGGFVHGRTGKPLRFWAVNGPSAETRGPALRTLARFLAKRGVNLVRVHRPLFDKQGQPDPEVLSWSHEVVRTMKAEGIYTHFSIYFPLWFQPVPDLAWMPGYDGRQHPFAALFFHPEFQQRYRAWWQALLTTPDPETGLRLIDDPAVFGLEVQNEDSLFFWTFKDENLPPALRSLIETRFHAWALVRHGNVQAARKAWNNLDLPGDSLDEGRLALRPLWNIFNERTPRDQDTARFLFDSQRDFYRETIAYLRQLGFQGVINASNWATASPEFFGPLEKLSYAEGDFIDRHGYFSCAHEGDNAAWSIRDGHSYLNRSALRFDPASVGEPRQFNHPVMDPHYAGKPSMISETTFNRPNRNRSEAPLFYAVYGALQDSDAIVHFALDGESWDVKPRFWMQPWTLLSPAMAGQFPAAALIFRQSLIRTGDVLAEIDLGLDDLFALRGTPLPQDAAFDELRAADLPPAAAAAGSARLDPLLHFAGRSEVRFHDGPTRVSTLSLEGLVDRKRRLVRSSTGEIQLDYERGILRIDAPRAQGFSGNLAAAGPLATRSLHVESPLDLGHIVLVSLDNEPLESSRSMLLQVMSEEQTTGFRTKPASNGRQQIESIGVNPWQARWLAGAVRLTRPGAAGFTVTALDANGYPRKDLSSAESFSLLPDCLYYHIHP